MEIKQILRCFWPAYKYFAKYEMNKKNSTVYDFVNTFFFTFIGCIAGTLIEIYL